MIPTRWYLPFFLPSTVLMLGIALALLVAWLASRRASRPAARQAHGVSIAALLPGGGPWRITARLARTVAGTLAALLLVASMPVTAYHLVRATEAPYVPVDPATLPAADAIVVLSGAIVSTLGPDGYMHTRLAAANDRHETALRAFAAGRAPILALGDGRPQFEGAPTEAEYARDRAIARGVAPSAIITGPAANFTSDEASGLTPLLRERGIGRIILCTSAHHMARARTHYEAAEFEVTPLPCHFLTYGEVSRFGWMQMVPSARALEVVDTCAKEWLGRAAQAGR